MASFVISLKVVSYYPYKYCYKLRGCTINREGGRHGVEKTLFGGVVISEQGWEKMEKIIGTSSLGI